MIDSLFRSKNILNKNNKIFHLIIIISLNITTILTFLKFQREVRTSELMMIDRTFVAEEQSILNRLREQETKLNGNCISIIFKSIQLLI